MTGTICTDMLLSARGSLCHLFRVKNFQVDVEEKSVGLFWRKIREFIRTQIIDICC